MPRTCSYVPIYERVRELRDEHVIVAGYGPVGRMCAKQLESSGLNVTIIELNPDTVASQLRLNRDVVYGNATDEHVLETAGIARARALILTMPDEQQSLEACRMARKMNPSIFIAARTNFFSQGLLCKQAGADEVIVEEVVTAQAMRQAVVTALTEHTKPAP